MNRATLLASVGVLALCSAAAAQQQSFSNLPPATAITGNEIVPLDQPNVFGSLVTRKAPLSALLPFLAQNFANVTGSNAISTVGTLTSGGTGSGFRIDLTHSTIVGALPNANMPVPTATALGGTYAAAAPSHQYQTGTSATGTPTFAQPGFGDISGILSLPQLPYVPLPQAGGSVVAPFNLSVGGLPRFALGLTTPTTGDPWTSSDAVLIGGQSDMDSAHAYIRGMPYGPLDLGTNLSIVQTDRPVQGSRAGIGPNGIATAANYVDYDAVNVYNQAGTTPARIIASSAVMDPNDSQAHAVAYSPNTATFSPPLPAADAALLRQQMFIKTNSIGATDNQRTSLSVPDPNGKYVSNTYGGQLQGWALNAQGQVTSITVDGWVVLGSGNAATNQVPSTTYDTTITNYGVPAVFFGTPTKSFNENKVCNLLALNQPGTAPGQPGYGNNPLGTLGAQQTQCEGAEWDISSSITTPYLGTLHGLTIQSGATNGVPLSNDSYNLHLGGPMPHQIVIDELASSDWLKTNSAAFYGDAGPAYGTPVGTKAEAFEVQKFANGAINERMATFLQRDELNAAAGGSDAGPGTHSFHMAMIEGGNLGDPTTGAIQSQVVFGGTSNVGGLSLCTYGQNANGPNGDQCSLSVPNGAPPLAYFGLKIGNNANSSGLDVNGMPVKNVSSLQLAPVTIANLPVCSAANAGLVAFVSDTASAAAPSWHGAVTGGGSTSVSSMVSCTGSGWQYD